MYVTDKGGLKAHAESLVNAMKKLKVDVILSNQINYNDFDIVHIQFDYSLFHPFGLRIVPKLMRLKFNKKKVVLTIGTILKKREIYTRNKFFTFLKKIVLPISTKMIAFFSDKVIVMIGEMKETLIADYKINKEKVEVIAHGIY